MTAYTLGAPLFPRTSLNTIEPSGNVAPDGIRPFCNAPNALAFMLTRIRGTCALDPLRMSVVLPERFGKGVYDVNGSVWVTNEKNAESELMASGLEGKAGEAGLPLPPPQEMQNTSPAIEPRRHMLLSWQPRDDLIAILTPRVDSSS